MPTTLPNDPNTVARRVVHWAGILSTCSEVAEKVNSERLPRATIRLTPERVKDYISVFMRDYPELGLNPLPLRHLHRTEHSGTNRERQRQGAGDQDHSRYSASGRMSPAQAYEILGLTAGATEEQIRAAYYRLLKRIHPDVGGSEFFTKQLNAAREVLLG